MDKLRRLYYLAKELIDLGFKGSLFRITYEILNRSGARRLLQPVKSRNKVSCAAYPGRDAMSLRRFRRDKKPFFITEPAELAKGIKKLSRIPQEEIIQEAVRAEAGQIKCFSRWHADYGNPVNWHLNPVRIVSWPANEHWSRVPAYEKQCGDCKLTWEINRFPHLFTWLRAYALTGDSRWVKAWTTQLKEWEDANPYRAGLNWSSGQELAIRSLSWIAGLYLFVEDESFREEDFQRLLRLLNLHGRHIYANINYARLAVHNNHLIGEALALYLLGGLFPWMRGAGKWKRRGRRLLEKDCLRQFYRDGGYCQSSHNYHRLALHYYLWACRAGECLGEPFDGEVYRAVKKSLHYLLAQINLPDGRLPNWGANDGALLCPWTACDYSDFRPVLTAASYLTTGKRLFGDGPWDEELLWLWGPDALNKPVQGYDYQRLACFPESGLYCLRQSAGDFAVFRCGSLRDRFGQADQLHTDIWWRGLNMARDGGSYLYNDAPPYHRHFMGSGSHNTVTVDGRDQMLLLRKFKWLGRVQAGNVSINDGNGATAAAGEHYGYRRLPGKVLHRRRVSSMGGGVYVVVDYLTTKTPVEHRYDLHWLLGPWPYEVFEDQPWRRVAQQTPAGGYDLRICTLSGDFERFKEADCSVVKGLDGHRPRGWESRYYGRRQAVASAIASCLTDKDIYFLSIFSPAEIKQSIIIEGKVLEARFNDYKWSLKL
ncbi:MAG: Heparin-sulfate lyase precursor [Pelotomaculum sp. PtaB.Bin104]|nr:MAG: Heparin-sulfate lyase precursor [Pelotomaculum sp. PtaB.Bin104]